MKSRYKNVDELRPYINIRSYSKDSVPGPPVSLIVIGRKNQIIKDFRRHGWFLAESISLISVIRSGLATLFDLSYHQGPMYSAYIDNKPHLLGFERPTKTDSFRRRHHLRLWRSRLSLNRRPVWLGTISYDRGIGLKKGALLLIHHTSPSLRLEEDFLAKTFGVKEPIYVTLSQRESGVMYSGDSYIWDGKALLLDLTR